MHPQIVQTKSICRKCTVTRLYGSFPVTRPVHHPKPDYRNYGGFHCSPYPAMTRRCNFCGQVKPVQQF